MTAGPDVIGREKFILMEETAPYAKQFYYWAEAHGVQPDIIGDYFETDLDSEGVRALRRAGSFFA